MLRTEAHPDAAKVHRVWVDAGDGVEHHVWCGAFNFAAGDLVPFAPVGTALPDGTASRRAAILGIPSEGMLCSAHELGSASDHSGIMVLPATATLGAPYGDAIGLVADVVFDVDVTRNRPDCLGTSAWPATSPRGSTCRSPCPSRRSWPAARAPRAGRHRRRRSCGRASRTVVLSGSRVAPSRRGWRAAARGRSAPDQQRGRRQQLRHARAGPAEPRLRPRHPGRRRLPGAPRRAGGALTTLDGVDRGLTDDDLLICDAHDVPIGLAGIMGGADTEITDATSTVALECAWFEPYGIAAHGDAAGLRSDASSRFERGVDPYGIDRGVARFVELLAETCPELVVHAGAVDARTEALPARGGAAPCASPTSTASSAPTSTPATSPALLDPIGYTVDGAGAVVDVALPSWRPDSAEEIDVIEEVGRHYGYANIVSVCRGRRCTAT